MTSIQPIIKNFFYLCFFFIAANFIAALAAPIVIAPIENLAGRALSYEVLLRLYLIFVCALAAYFLTLAAQWRDRASIWWHGLIFVWSTFLTLVVVFIFDQRWSLTEEYSWMRYPTALALFLSGWWWFKIAYRQRSKLAVVAVAVALGSAFLFAASDELFLIHETIGAFLQKLFFWPGFTTDLVTVFYGLAGLVFIIFAAKILKKSLSPARQQFLLKIYIGGLLLFGLAAMFDTLDNQIFNAIQRLSDSLVWRDHQFSDYWFIIWKPKIFLNSWEEILELVAAGLFAFGAYGLLVPEHFLEARAEKDRVPRRKIWLLVSGLLLTIILTLIVLSWPKNNFSSLRQVANLKQGLFHADDLFFHPAWGVIVANESRPELVGANRGPGVFLWQNNEWTRLPDPQQQLRDVDSVTANARAIYVSDSTQGKIFKYACAQMKPRTDCVWTALPSAKNFPPHPEGLFVDEQDIITVVDESEGSITQIKPTGEITTERPIHPLWKTPEGIIWHPFLKKFLITDDTTGAIFKYIPGQAPLFFLKRAGQALEIFADSTDGLRFPEDVAIGPKGEVLVSDNGRREIIVFNSDGQELKRWRFGLLYRDLQGLTFNERGAILVISSNGFDNASFISSALWEIKDIWP